MPGSAIQVLAAMAPRTDTFIIYSLAFMVLLLEFTTGTLMGFFAVDAVGALIDFATNQSLNI